MSEECTHDCSNCGAACSSRNAAPQHDAPNPNSSVKKVIGVVSGKGGVGKSMTSALLACAMARRGYHCGILDADITGPSIPKLFGIHGRAMADDKGCWPIQSRMGIDVMSINLLVENEEDPVVWRGPVIAGAVKQFWTDVVWKDTSYVSLLLNKKGDFTIQGGQHTITYETDESLADGQYYLYMFDNNIGISETRPDYDWSSIGLKVSSAVDGKNSKYYKYLVDENEGTFELVDSFKVPYSGYVSSAQETEDNVLVDSGLKGTFTEYDADHKAIVTYKMNYEKFIYRVFKYKFDGFYFEKSE